MTGRTITITLDEYAIRVNSLDERWFVLMLGSTWTVLCTIVFVRGRYAWCYGKLKCVAGGGGGWLAFALYMCTCRTETEPVRMLFGLRRRTDQFDSPATKHQRHTRKHTHSPTHFHVVYVV